MPPCQNYYCTLIRDGLPSLHVVSATSWRHAALRTLSENNIGRSEDVLVKVYFDMGRTSPIGKLELKFDLF